MAGVMPSKKSKRPSKRWFWAVTALTLFILAICVFLSGNLWLTKSILLGSLFSLIMTVGR